LQLKSQRLQKHKIRIMLHWGTFDYLPSQYITFRWEFDHRAANVPYFSGRGGITPPGGNTGAPGSVVPGFTPDLVRDENRLNLAILVKF
jgi:hypothetical protein